MKDLNEAAALFPAARTTYYDEEAELYQDFYTNTEFNQKEFYMNIIKSWNIRRPRLISIITY